MLVASVRVKRRSNKEARPGGKRQEIGCMQLSTRNRGAVCS